MRGQEPGLHADGGLNITGPNTRDEVPGFGKISDPGLCILNDRRYLKYY